MRKKILRVTTVPMSLSSLLKGQLKYVSNYYDIIGISSPGDGFLDDVGKKENVKTFGVEMTRKITPFKDLIAVYKLYLIFKRERPFIVHSHTPKAGTLSMIAARLAKVPHRLHTIAGLPLVEATGVKRFLLNFVERITYKFATKIYPNSFGLVDIILENNFTTKDKLKVLANGSSNGIDTSHFNPNLYDLNTKKQLRKDLAINETDFVFVYIGRLVKDKGVNELICAFDLLNKEFKNIKLLLVGWYENELDPLLKETELIIKTNKNIITTGWVSDVRPYFALSNCLVFASYREGFPNVVLQAAALELVAIVTNINGCNEVIEDGKNGFIIPIKDAQAIYEKMFFVLNNKNICIEMGKTSRSKVVEKYEQKIVWSAILKEYNNLE